VIALWNRVKSYAVLALTVLVSLLGFLARFFYLRSQEEKKNAREAKARADHAKKVMVEDNEIELEHDTRTEELADEIKKGSSTVLSDPNKW